MSDPQIPGDGHVPELPELQLVRSQVLALGGAPSAEDERAGRRLTDWRPGLLVLFPAQTG